MRRAVPASAGVQAASGLYIAIERLTGRPLAVHDVGGLSSEWTPLLMQTAVAKWPGLPSDTPLCACIDPQTVALITFEQGMLLLVKARQPPGKHAGNILHKRDLLQTPHQAQNFLNSAWSPQGQLV